MIHINNKLKLEEFKKEKDFCVIIDFDRTITTASSTATMGIIPEYIGGEFLEKRKKIYNHYRPIEIDYTIDNDKRKEILKEWTIESFKMLCENINSEDVIKDAIENCNLHLRDGVKVFFTEMKKKNIPVIIMSAGLGNLIKEFLKKEEILYNNMYIISNYIDFKGNKAYIEKDKMIATSNKEYSIIPRNIGKTIESKKQILLLGDVLEDLKMVDESLKEKTMTIGFLDRNIDKSINVFNKNFDIVLTDNETFETVNELIKEEL